MSETGKYVRRSAADIQAMKTFYGGGGGGRSFAEVGIEFGISPSRVEQLFRQHHVKTRPQTVSQKFLAAMRKRRVVLEKQPLADLYLQEKLSIQKIADRLATTFHIVRSNLIAHRIPVRPLENYTTSRLTPEILRPLYIDQNLTAAQIAERLGYSILTIRKKLSVFGIKRNVSEPHGEAAIRGENFVPRQRSRIKARQARPRLSEPNAAAIEGRGAYARAKIKRLHGYGKREIGEIIALGKSGLTPAEIAIRFRLDEGIVADLLAQAAGRELLKRQKLALKPPRPKPPPKNRHSPKRLKKLPEKAILLELYENVRLPKKAILSKLKINDATLYNALLRYGIPLRSVRSRQRSEEREQMLRRMFTSEELPLQTIADRLGLSLNQVRKSLRFLRNDDGTPLQKI